MLVTASVGPVKKTLGKKGIQDAVRAYETRRPLYVDFGLRLSELLRELLSAAELATPLSAWAISLAPARSSG